MDRRKIVDWDVDDRPSDGDLVYVDRGGYQRAWYAHQAVAHAERQAAERWRVPSYKFQSNDYWAVFPNECRLIADALRAATHEDAAAVTGEYDEAASRYPGVRVAWAEDRVADLLDTARWVADFAEAADGLGGFLVG